LNTPISRIQLSEDGKHATGVVLADANETLTADIVICNADLIYAYNNLLPSTSYARSLSKRDASCSSISFYWGLDRQFPELSAHNIFLAENYKESFDSIFKKHLIPKEPSFYVNVPSRVDPSAAPKGGDTLVVLVPVGHLLDSESNAHKGRAFTKGKVQDWNSMVSSAKETILRTMESRLKISLSGHIKTEAINTPLSWKSTFNLDRGAILGLSHSFFNVLCFRPKTQHPNIQGLYFVGASTHPGTGVPIVFASAKLVAEQVFQNQHLIAPWEKKTGDAEKVGKLDQIQWSPLDWFHWVLVLIVGLVAAICGALFTSWEPGKVPFTGDW
jgi:phytoene desaturase (3,4-didehydrolycopene-forming)